MRKKDNQEHRVQLAAARHGLKLVRNRSRAATGRSLYCLRAIWNAACVVGSRPEGGLGLVYAQTGRAVIASWLTLSEIAQVLANWREPAPEGRVTAPGALHNVQIFLRPLIAFGLRRKVAITLLFGVRLAGDDVECEAAAGQLVEGRRPCGRTRWARRTPAGARSDRTFAQSSRPRAWRPGTPRPTRMNTRPGPCRNRPPRGPAQTPQ